MPRDPDQVAGLGVLQRDLLAGIPLLAGCARQFDAVLAVDVLGVSRAVPAGLRRGAAPDVLDAEVGLRILDDGRTLGRDLLGLARLVLLLVVLLGVVLGLIVLFGVVLLVVLGLVVLRVLVVCRTFPGVCRRLVIGGIVSGRCRAARSIVVGDSAGNGSLGRELGGSVTLGPDQTCSLEELLTAFAA